MKCDEYNRCLTLESSAEIQLGIICRYIVYNFDTLYSVVAKCRHSFELADEFSENDFVIIVDAILV